MSSFDEYLAEREKKKKKNGTNQVSVQNNAPSFDEYLIQREQRKKLPKVVDNNSIEKQNYQKVIDKLKNKGFKISDVDTFETRKKQAELSAQNKITDINNVKNVNDIYNFAQNNKKSYKEQLKDYNASIKQTLEDSKKIEKKGKELNIDMPKSSTYYNVPTLSSVQERDISAPIYDRHNKQTLLQTPTEIKQQAEKELARQKLAYEGNIKNSEERKDYIERKDKINAILGYSKDIAKNREDKSNKGKYTSPFMSGLDNAGIGFQDKFRTEEGELVALPTYNDIRASKFRSESDSSIYNAFSDVSQSVGNMVPGIVAGTASGGLGSAVFFTNTYNTARNQALLEGYDNKSASNYALINATLELGVGKVLGGASAIMRKSPVAKQIGSKLTSKIMSNPVLASYTADMISEFGEEYVQEWLDPKVKAYFLEHKDIGEAWDSSKFLDEQNLYAGLLGALSAGTMNIPNAARQQVNINSQVDSLIQSAEVYKGSKLTDTEKKSIKDSFYNEYNKAMESTKKDKSKELNIDYEAALNKSGVLNETQTEQNNNNINKNTLLPNEKTFSEQIDDVLNNKYPKRDMLVVSSNTPKVLQDIGLKDLPITMTQKHLYTMTNSDGKYKNVNYHNIPVDIIKQIPNALEHPLNVLKSDTKDGSIVVVTELSDANNDIVVASIKIDGKGQINNINIDSNVMTSAYGKSNNYDYFMKDNISKGNLLYDIDDGIVQKINTKKETDATDRIQFPMRSSSKNTSDISKNISPFSDNNNTTNGQKSQLAPTQTVFLTDTEKQELNELNNMPFELSEVEAKRLEYLNNKQKGYVEKYPGLKNKVTFNDIKSEYGKYKDLKGFDASVLQNAESFVKDYRNTGRRTKSEWLNVANMIGNNIKTDSSEELTKYAIQSWLYAKPNTKENLNRQGKGYVNFSIEEWINEVYKGAGVGELVKNNNVNLPTTETTKPNIPIKENTKEETKNVNIPLAKKDNVIKVNANKIAEQINKTGGFDVKQRSWATTSTESDVLKDKVYIEDLNPNEISYVVQSNKKSLDKANNKINALGYEGSINHAKELLNSEKLPTASDVAFIQRMIQEASKKGDYETTQNLIMDAAILGTDLGQATQALSIIQKLTPEGQLKLYTKMVQRAKVRGEKSFQNVEITPEMVKKVLDAYNADGTFDQNDLNSRVESFKQDIADQMKTTVGEKIDAWRYLSMLGNPKTHIRNIVSNVAMKGTIKVKNAMARTLETLLPVKERTKTWKKTSNDIKNYAEQTANEMKGIITGENKYNEKSSIESKKQIFKNKALEKLSNLNSNALEAEDWFFSKRAFRDTLQEYLTANDINTLEDIKNNPELVEKAKNYAVEQAEIATFRQYSKLAATINRLESKNKLARFALEATIPFKKTPINVAKAGVNYSPLGLIKNITYDAYQLKQGNINASQFIDNISQGMTGTSLAVLGYALAKAGILSGSGGDDKDDKYDKQLGNKGYSVNVGGNSYSISWLSPVAMPLLVGANAYEQLEEEKEWDMNVVSESLAKTLDPLNEMSFMQGVTSALQSYGSGPDKIKGSLESVGQNYVSQFFPTLFSQIASVGDDTKRSTQAANNSKYKFGEQTVRGIMYKIPGLRNQLEPITDIWGNEKKQSDSILERAFESFISPYSKTEKISTELDDELKRVYKETGETKVIPGIPYGYVKYGDETYRMSAKDYTEFKKTYGQTANETLNDLISSSKYQNADDEDKVKMIDATYDYARSKAKEEYFDKNGVDYEDKLLNKLNTLESEFGIDASEYITNKKGYDYAYQYPSKYRLITQITDYDDYVKYKEEIQDIRDNTKDDKQETIKYINSLKLSVPQKAMFIKKYYKSFTQYDNEIIKYINSQKLNTNEKQQILTELGFKIRDGKVYTK